jgi:hypothetical protein
MRPRIITWRFFHYWELFLFRNDSAAFQMIPHDLSLPGVMAWVGYMEISGHVDNTQHQ